MRLHADMVQTFKIVKGIDRVDRRQKAARLEIRRNFFSIRVIDYWNLIPSEVKMQEQ